MDLDFDLDFLDNGHENIEQAEDIKRNLAQTSTKETHLLSKIKNLENEKEALQAKLLDLNESALQVKSLYDQEKVKVDNLSVSNKKIVSELETTKEELVKTQNELTRKDLLNEQIRADYEVRLENEKSRVGAICKDMAAKYLQQSKLLNEHNLLDQKAKREVSDVKKMLNRNQIEIPEDCLKFKKDKKSKALDITKNIEKCDASVTCNILQCSSPKIETCTRATQYITSTTTRSASTSAFIKKHDVSTNFPEVIPMTIEDILKETLYSLPSPISPIQEILSASVASSTQTNDCEMKSVSTCTRLRNIRRKVDFLKKKVEPNTNSAILEKIKSESPASSTMNLNYSTSVMDDVKVNTSILHPPGLTELWNLLGQTIFALISSGGSHLNQSQINVLNERMDTLNRQLQHEMSRKLQLLTVQSNAQFCGRSFYDGGNVTAENSNSGNSFNLPDSLYSKGFLSRNTPSVSEDNLVNQTENKDEEINRNSNTFNTTTQSLTENLVNRIINESCLQQIRNGNLIDNSLNCSNERNNLENECQTLNSKNILPIILRKPTTSSPNTSNEDTSNLTINSYNYNRKSVIIDLTKIQKEKQNETHKTNLVSGDNICESSQNLDDGDRNLIDENKNLSNENINKVADTIKDDILLDNDSDVDDFVLAIVPSYEEIQKNLPGGIDDIEKVVEPFFDKEHNFFDNFKSPEKVLNKNIVNSISSLTVEQEFDKDNDNELLKKNLSEKFDNFKIPKRVDNKKMDFIAEQTLKPIIDRKELETNEFVNLDKLLIPIEEKETVKTNVIEENMDENEDMKDISRNLEAKDISINKSINLEDNSKFVANNNNKLDENKISDLQNDENAVDEILKMFPRQYNKNRKIQSKLINKKSNVIIRSKTKKATTKNAIKVKIIKNNRKTKIESDKEKRLVLENRNVASVAEKKCITSEDESEPGDLVIDMKGENDSLSLSPLKNNINSEIDADLYKKDETRKRQTSSGDTSSMIETKELENDSKLKISTCNNYIDHFKSEYGKYFLPDKRNSITECNNINIYQSPDKRRKMSEDKRELFGSPYSSADSNSPSDNSIKSIELEQIFSQCLTDLQPLSSLSESSDNENVEISVKSNENLNESIKDDIKTPEQTLSTSQQLSTTIKNDTKINHFFEKITPNINNIYESPTSPESKSINDSYAETVIIPTERIILKNKTDEKSNSKLYSIVGKILNKFDKKKQETLFRNKTLNKTANFIKQVNDGQKIIEEFINCNDTTVTNTVCCEKLIKLSNTNIKILLSSIMQAAESITDTESLQLTPFIPNFTLKHMKIVILVTELKTHIHNINDNLINSIEEKLFTLKDDDKISLCNACNLTLLYIGIINSRTELPNPSRFFIYKCLYYYNKLAMPMIYYILKAYPDVLPIKDAPNYDNSDALITTIQCILNSFVYKFDKIDLKHKEIYNILKWKYKYERVKPAREDVIENLMLKIKSGKFKDVSYSLALLCKRNGIEWTDREVICKHFEPALIEYYNLILENDNYDMAVCVILECISYILKPFPITYDISKFLHIFTCYLHATNRKLIQEAAISAVLRVSRFSIEDCFYIICKWNPCFKISDTLHLMLLSFIYRKPLNYWKELEKIVM